MKDRGGRDYLDATPFLERMKYLTRLEACAKTLCDHLAKAEVGRTSPEQILRAQDALRLVVGQHGCK